MSRKLILLAVVLVAVLLAAETALAQQVAFRSRGGAFGRRQTDLVVNGGGFGSQVFVDSGRSRFRGRGTNVVVNGFGGFAQPVFVQPRAVVVPYGYGVQSFGFRSFGGCGCY